MVGGKFKEGNSSLENAGVVFDSFICFGSVRRFVGVQFSWKMSNYVIGS